jgi:putative redox protein
LAHEIETQWIGKMEFNTAINGHTLVMDAPERVGGEDHGPIPKPLILAALSGCTGMDVVALLRKTGKSVDSFALKVTGEISKQQPIEYTAIHIIYEFTGSPENAQAALDAVTASQEKYCGVSHMLKKILPVAWDVMYNAEMIFTNKACAMPQPH